jgi:uncharacterized protein YecE (DUF72 family)
VDFVLKAHQDITHRRERASVTLPQFQNVLSPFLDAEVLKAVLLQFPYSFKHTLESRDHLLWLRESLFEISLVVEFRHRSWITEEVHQFLRQNDISYCCVDEPRLPGLPPSVAWATGPIGYVRFHGRNRQKWWDHKEAQERYDYLYTEGELREWLPKIWRLEKATEMTFVFFNNHPNGQGAINAQLMQEMLSS